MGVATFVSNKDDCTRGARKVPLVLRQERYIGIKSSREPSFEKRVILEGLLSTKQIFPYYGNATFSFLWVGRGREKKKKSL